MPDSMRRLLPDSWGHPEKLRNAVDSLAGIREHIDRLGTAYSALGLGPEMTRRLQEAQKYRRQASSALHVGFGSETMRRLQETVAQQEKLLATFVGRYHPAAVESSIRWAENARRHDELVRNTLGFATRSDLQRAAGVALEAHNAFARLFRCPGPVEISRLARGATDASKLIQSVFGPTDVRTVGTAVLVQPGVDLCEPRAEAAGR